MGSARFARVAWLLVGAGIAAPSTAPAVSASGNPRSSENLTSLGQPESIAESRVARQTRLPLYSRQLAYYPFGASYGSVYANRFGNQNGPRFGSQFGTRFASPFGSRFGSQLGSQFGGRLGGQFSRPIYRPVGSSLGAFLPIQGPSSAVLIPQLAVNYPIGLPYVVGIPYPVYIPLIPTGGGGVLFPDDAGFDAAAK
uniref:Putative secreted protein n=1 Tax=Ixodes ricinus TaxID=34613 RepID=A0A147BLC4_IXORI